MGRYGQSRRPGTRACFLRQAGRDPGRCPGGRGGRNGGTVPARLRPDKRCSGPAAAQWPCRKTLSGQSWAHSSQPVHRVGNSCTATLPSGWGVNCSAFWGQMASQMPQPQHFSVKRGDSSHERRGEPASAGAAIPGRPTSAGLLLAAGQELSGQLAQPLLTLGQGAAQQPPAGRGAMLRHRSAAVIQLDAAANSSAPQKIRSFSRFCRSSAAAASCSHWAQESNIQD